MTQRKNPEEKYLIATFSYPPEMKFIIKTLAESQQLSKMIVWLIRRYYIRTCAGLDLDEGKVRLTMIEGI